MARVSTRIELDGNFFRRDPKKTVRANITDMLDGLASWMESEVQSDISAHASSMPGYSGWTREHIVGRVHANSGKRWALNAVVSANTAGMSKRDAIRTRAAAATIERRWHPFRRVKGGAVRARAVVAANLTKGLE